MKLLAVYKTFARPLLGSFLVAGFTCNSTLADSSPSSVITYDSINLSAADFLPNFISQSTEKREAARLYLLGVLDSTEGKTWCSYSQIKTVTINEFVFEYLRKQSAEKLKARASTLIEEALTNHFPCKDTK